MAEPLLQLDAARAIIASAAALENIDEAIAAIMAQAGITSGDVAGLFFSKFDDVHEHWSALDLYSRQTLMSEYLDFEEVYTR